MFTPVQGFKMFVDPKLFLPRHQKQNIWDILLCLNILSTYRVISNLSKLIFIANISKIISVTSNSFPLKQFDTLLDIIRVFWYLMPIEAAISIFLYLNNFPEELKS